MPGIRKVAGYLANVKQNDKGEYSYTPDPNSPEDVREFDNFYKSKYLIRDYSSELNIQNPGYTPSTFFVDSQMGQSRREIFVVVTITSNINRHKEADAWFDYLRFMGNSDLKSLQDQSEREKSPEYEQSTPRLTSPDYRNTSPQITAPPGGAAGGAAAQTRSKDTTEVTSVRDANWFPEREKPEGLRRRQREKFDSSKARRVATYQSLREKESQKNNIQRLREKIAKRHRSPEKEGDVEYRLSKHAIRESEITEKEESGSYVFQESDKVK
jgi:hypothetical protein